MKTCNGSAPLLVAWFCSVIALLTAGMASPASALEIYVSPAGSDNQPGTLRAPVRTLEAARALARARAGRDRVTIIVQDGIYYLDRPLVLTDRKSVV